MSEPEELHESDYECRGCGRQFNGPWSMDHHTQRCQKVLLADDTWCVECGSKCCNGECYGDDMMGSSS